jgi:hypothetical protein
MMIRSRRQEVSSASAVRSWDSVYRKLARNHHSTLNDHSPTNSVSNDNNIRYLDKGSSTHHSSNSRQYHSTK